MEPVVKRGRGRPALPEERIRRNRACRTRYMIAKSWFCYVFNMNGRNYKLAGKWRRRCLAVRKMVTSHIPTLTRGISTVGMGTSSDAATTISTASRSQLIGVKTLSINSW